MAIASSAIEMRSPEESSMSSSRAGGRGLTWLARSINSSVVSPLADTTTATSCPSRLVAAMRWATRLMLSASATEEPPFFCSSRATRVHSSDQALEILTRQSLPRSAVFPTRRYPAMRDFRRLLQRAGNLPSSRDLFLHHVQTCARGHGIQGPQCRARVVAPEKEEAEQPPPERLELAVGLVVPPSVHQVTRHVDKVVGQPVGGRLIVLVRVEHLGVVVHLGEAFGQPLAYGVQVGILADVRLPVVGKDHVGAGAALCPRHRDLRA